MEGKSIILYGLIAIAILIVSIPILGFIVGPGEPQQQKVINEAINNQIKPIIGDTIINDQKNMINEEKKEIVGTMVNIQTTKGNIQIELFDKDAPITVQNFLSLIEKDFYDGIIFHRVINGFMIQGGCPLGTGFGGSEITIPCEFISRIENNRGTLSMANAGRDTGSSQFFINLVDNNFLDGRHTVFGRVIEGIEIIDTIGAVETDVGDRPVSDVIIKDIKLENRI